MGVKHVWAGPRLWRGPRIRGGSSCPATQSIARLVRLAHRCQSIWTGQVFSLRVFPAPHQKPDKGPVGSSPYRESSARIRFAGGLEFRGPGMAFLAGPFCKRSHPHALKRCLTLFLFLIWARSQPQVLRTREGAFREPQERATFARYQPGSKGFSAFSPPPHPQNPTNEATTLSYLLSVGFFVVRKVKKSTELFPFPTPPSLGISFPTGNMGGLFWLVEFGGGLMTSHVA